MPLEKLILGIPYYGRSFTLQNKNERSFGSACAGEGQPGESTRESGFLSYGFEICKYLKSQNWTRAWSREHQVPYAYKQSQWVGYDDEESIKVKVNYVTKYCLGGAMVWSIDLDDFKGFCADKPYPLTRTVLSQLKGIDRRKCLPLKRVVDDQVEEYLANVKKWVPTSSEIKDSSEESTQLIEVKSTGFAKQNELNKIFTTTTATTKISSSSSTIKKVSSTISSSTLTSKKPELDYRSEQLNEIMLRYYQSTNFKKDEIDKFLKQIFQNSDTFLLKSEENKSVEKLKIFKPQMTTVQYITTRKPIMNPKSENFGCEMLEDGEFVRDPVDCGSFYTCFRGKVSKKTTCDKGLFFDNRLKVCNWKSQVLC